MSSSRELQCNLSCTKYNFIFRKNLQIIIFKGIKQLDKNVTVEKDNKSQTLGFPEDL